jgi:formamidopyrimidine-DNA glycosylase
MPELPEVETVVRTLRPRIVGGMIAGVRLERPDILDPIGTDLPGHLRGRVITAVERRGKRIVITLDDCNRFYIHLGMTGRLTVEPINAPLQSHTHLILEVFVGSALADETVPERTTAGSRKIPSAKADPTEISSANSFHVRFRDPRRFGGIWWLGRETSPNDRMGPEPLSLRATQLARQLAKTRRAVKTALLDQTLIAGLGNIYVDESLFAAGVHPLTPANRLTTIQIAALNRAIKHILRKAILHRGSTLRDYRDANGESGGFQLRHKVYDRADQPCRACKAPIQRIVLGGRSTHFCPKCQGR